jgi:hypothetical protein
MEPYAQITGPTPRSKISFVNTFSHVGIARTTYVRKEKETLETINRGIYDECTLKREYHDSNVHAKTIQFGRTGTVITGMAMASTPIWESCIVRGGLARILAYCFLGSVFLMDMRGLLYKEWYTDRFLPNRTVSKTLTWKQDH